MPQLWRTSNPALNEQTFRGERAAIGGDAMTVQGTVNKTGILLLCALATAAWTWNIFMHTRTPEAVAPMAIVGLFGGLILAMVTIFKKSLVSNNRAAVRAVRRSGAGKRFGHSRTAVSWNRHSGGEPHVRRFGVPAAGVHLWNDSRDR